MKTILRWIAFAVLLCLGVVGLLLPLVPQLPFLIAALLVIMPVSPWLRKKYVLWRTRHPRLFRPIERWRERRRAARRDRAVKERGG